MRTKIAEESRVNIDVCLANGRPRVWECGDSEPTTDNREELSAVLCVQDVSVSVESRRFRVDAERSEAISS